MEALFRQLDTSLTGLSSDEAVNRLKQYGPNQVARRKSIPWWLQLLKTFNSPFNYLLLLLGLVSFYSGNPASALFIAVMVLLSVLLRFFQEHRSNKAAERLQSIVSNKICAYRDGQPVRILIANLVPGDVIQLSAGDLIPADIRLLETTDLHINQSTLTGESFPVEKRPELEREIVNEPVALSNLCFMGTSVISGMGKAVVLATGDQTRFGNLAIKIIEQEPPTTFEKGISSLSWLLIRFILGMVVIILLINGFTKGDWLTAFLFSLSVGVGLTPEMLPMIVTTNLSRGALALSGKKVIVKRLTAIQNLGAMDILCADKTGTLTQNKIILYRHLDLHGNESLEVLKYAYLNSHFQTGLKNLLDEAILNHAEQDDSLRLEQDYQKVDEVPFDFERRRLSVIIRKNHDHILICKGAVEETLAVCSQIHDKGHEYPMTPEIKAKVTEEARRLNEDGFRVVGIAYKKTDPGCAHYSAADEKDLTLLGYIAFLDPPRETTTEAIDSLKKLGITLKILTGDNELVTQKICHTVNLPVQGILLGSEIDRLSDNELSQQAEATTIFAKLSPEHKQRIIKAFRQNHVVGFLGDGINDAPALKTADIGLSVDHAADIARESADIILLEQSLLVLRDGVLEGRKVFGNLIKYIRMTTSSNFGNVLSMVGASFLLPFLPMKPIQILTQNLLYDFSQTAIPFDTVDEEFLVEPHQWKILDIEHFMLIFGPISSLFDYALFAVMWFVFQANTIPRQELFQTGWFIEGLLSQILIVHLIRTAKIPFIQSWPAPQLMMLTLIIMAIGIYLPHSPLAPFFGFVLLPGTYFVWLFVILINYFILTQLIKGWFIRKYGYG
jgi:Mg2+-importing ATPase